MKSMDSAKIEIPDQIFVKCVSWYRRGPTSRKCVSREQISITNIWIFCQKQQINVVNNLLRLGNCGMPESMDLSYFVKSLKSIEVQLRGGLWFFNVFTKKQTKYNNYNKISKISASNFDELNGFCKSHNL